MTARVPVTVALPVTEHIGADDVRAYLVDRGWAPCPEYNTPQWEAYRAPKRAVLASLPVGDRNHGIGYTFGLQGCIHDIAAGEEREPADVLREIAALARPEPEEHAPGDRCAECGHKFGTLNGVGHGRGVCPIDVDGEACGCPAFMSKEESAAMFARLRKARAADVVDPRDVDEPVATTLVVEGSGR